MKNKQNIRITEHKLFRSIVISYIMVLILPMIVLGMFSTIYSSRILQDREHDNAYQNIVRTGTIIDRELSGLKDNAIQISMDTNIRHVMFEQDYVEQKYARWQALNMIMNSNVTQKFPSEIIVYFSKGKEFLSSSSYYDQTLFYVKYPVDGMTSGEFLEWIEDKNDGLEYVSAGKETRRYMLFSSPLPIHEGKTEGVVLMWVEWGKISPMFAYSNQDLVSHMNFIVKEDGSILYASEDPDKNGIEEWKLDIEALQNSGSYVLNGETYMVSRYDSQVYPVSYITMASTKDIVRSGSTLWYYLVGSLLICTLFGGIIIYLMSMRNYRPVYNLVNYIDSGERCEEMKQFANLERAMNKVGSLYEEKNSLRRTLDLQLPYVEYSILDNLIHGRYEDRESVQTMQATLNQIPETDYYAVVIATIDDYLGFSSRQDEAMLNVASMTVSKIVKEMLHDSMQILHLAKRKKIIFLLNLRRETTADPAFMQEELVDVRDYIKENARIMISLGVSSIFKGFDQIPKGYEEARIALNAGYYAGNGSIETYHEAQNSKLQYYYPIDKENQFMNKLTHGDASGAAEILQEIYDANMSARKNSLTTGYCLAFGMLGSIIKAINEIELDYDLSDLMKKILDGITQDEERVHIFEDIQLTVFRIGELVHSRRENSNSQQNHRIIQYLNENYGDMNLSLTSMADQFHMSAPYLSRYFKEQFGMNFADYLCRLRISVSKRLLEDPKLTINDITEQVGYNSANSFIRTFKRYEGITPGQYRDQIKNE